MAEPFGKPEYSFPKGNWAAPRSWKPQPASKPHPDSPSAATAPSTSDRLSPGLQCESVAGVNVVRPPLHHDVDQPARHHDDLLRGFALGVAQERFARKRGRLDGTAIGSSVH